jgi:alkanesulfonate monooxygenase SsuD/methylene tetrahydromethanopterin reductase-like flavin-dependent oxidoreductase (luciferase family)
MENWEIIKMLLTETNVSYSGKWRSITNVTTLPRPRSQDIIERAHYSWGSKTSLRFAAEAGFSPLFVAKGSPEENGADIREFNQIRTDLGWEPTKPIICLNVFADPDPYLAREEGRRYLREFYSNTLDHYQRFDAQHFHQAGNYQETAQQAELLARRDRDEVLDELAALQVTGTPDEVLQQVEVWKQAMGPSQILLAMKFGGMPADVATKNIHTVSGLLPELATW